MDNPPAVTHRGDAGLVLVLFPGIDMLGKGFELEGFTIVRGPDPLWGGSIERFSLVNHSGVFQGVIGGSPCQDFSKARRSPPTGYGQMMLNHFDRCVTEGQPEFFLLENVPGVPDVTPRGYYVQRFNVNAAEVGGTQNRLRCFQYGSKSGKAIVIPRSCDSAAASQKACMATEGKRSGASRRTFADFCQLQGLPADFDLPGMSRAAKYQAVGNGVPIYLAAVIARAIKLRRHVTSFRLCICNCGRSVHGKQLMATAACRKRMERERRDAAGVTVPGPVTDSAGGSQWLFPPTIHPAPQPSDAV